MKIAVVGSYGVGLTMRVPRMPVPGETLSGASFDEGPGGKGSNQAIGAARLGAEVSLLTAVGADAYGRTARDLWTSEGVDHSLVVEVAGAATMVGFILVEPSGENRIAIASGALDALDVAAVEGFRPAIAAADMLVVSMEIPIDAVVAALRIGAEEGTRTLLNPAPARAVPDEAWTYVDVITPNQSEAPILLGLPDDHGLNDDELAIRLATRTEGAVVLTRGGLGALIVEDGVLTQIPPVPVRDVVDTTGAGDSFTAALAVALAEGRSLPDAAGWAAHAGAHAVTIAGVIEALPTRDALPGASRPDDTQTDTTSTIGARR
ncbi:ribokinase [Microbacterium caowuchunii]|uniref:Ribokinase n=1 Tax=Microbacterium caowuchunii TaxID=2614638 RepID=A0A5N0TCI3_9MICO|nr:ribokinase [Microbacterium caowuchunii]KAA9132388.1 ribokinase [Microbacterium caowuchunii]